MPAVPAPDRLVRTVAVLIAAACTIALTTLALPAGALRGPQPPSTTLVVADLRGKALIVVDAPSGRSARCIALPGGPHELLQLPDGRLVVSLEQHGALALVDLATDAITTLDVGGLPHGLALRDGVLYATDRASGTLRRWRTADWSELTPSPAGAAPHAVALRADGSAVVADAAASTLRLGAHTHDTGALPETVAIDPADGRIAVAAAHGGDVALFDAAGGRVRSVALGGRPVRALFGPGGTLAVALSADGTVALIDANGGVRHVQVGGTPDGLAFDASGRWLYASDLHGRLALVDVAAAHLHGVVEIGGGGSLLALDPAVPAAAPAAAVRQ